MIFKKSNKAVLAWWHSNNGAFNFGDELNPYLIHKVSGKDVIRVHDIPRFSFFKINICIGSVLIKARPSCNVWGAGIIEKSSHIPKSNYFAVRGKYTQARMTELGIKPPKTIGDPALLLPLYFKPDVAPKFNYGITPHIVDFEMVQSNIKTKNVSVVDFTKPDVEEIIKDILACNLIISSSLHGIIVANAYNIPALWVKFSDKLYGDDIKFYDYFSSVGVNDNIQPVYISPNDFNIEMVVDNNKKNLIHPKKEVLKQTQTNLLDVCPFK